MKKIKVWDGPSRLFHWTLAAAFALSIYSAFQDKFGIYADIHCYAGYSTLTLVVWRILWGFWGSETARFGNFLKRPAVVRNFLRERQHPGIYRWIGHNPVGGWSVVLMLGLLLVQSLMGLFASDDLLFSGPFAAAAGSFSHPITEIHETLGKILIGLIGLHIAAAFYYGLRRINLILPMIFGDRRLPEDMEDTPEPAFVSPVRALLLFLPVALLVWLLTL